MDKFMDRFGTVASWVALIFLLACAVRCVYEGDLVHYGLP